MFIVLSMLILFSLSLKLKNMYLWIFSLSLFPYVMASNREYPNYLFFGSSCIENERNFETIFEMKNEVRKLSAPTMLELTEVTGLGRSLDFISMHSKWPQKKYFDKNCMVFYPLANKSMSSLDFPFLVKVSSTKTNNSEEEQCKTWANYKKIVVEKKFKQCSGEILNFTISTVE